MKRDASQTNPADSGREVRRRRRAWNLVRRLALGWLKRRYRFSYDEGFDPASIDGGLIILINHTNALDPLFTGAAFKNRPLSFVASEHLLRVKPWGALLNRYFYIIPHRKGRRGNHTSDAIIRHLAQGSAVYLSAEGEQSWDGLPGVSKPHTGKMIKDSGATLVTYRIEGGYLSKPRWSSVARKGKIYAGPAGIYDPQTLAQMTTEEIEAAVNRDLAFNVWDWQKAMPTGPVHFTSRSNDTAAGLERAVCACPSCGKIGTLSTAGDTVSCSCGFSLRWTETGFFAPDEPFETIVDWEAYDRETIAALLREHRMDWPADDHVSLRLVRGDHTDETLCAGILSIDFVGGRPLIVIGGFRFDMRAVTELAMILDNRIVFTAGGFYYELRTEHTNLRKYLIAWEELKKGGH